MRKPETGIPESTNQRKQVLQIRLKFFFCKTFACKKLRDQAKNSIKLPIFETKIPRLLKFVQLLFLVRVMIMRI